MKTGLRRYSAWVVFGCDSWGVSTQVEAGKVRENCGWCEIFCMDFLCVFSLSSGSSSVVRAHNLSDCETFDRVEARGNLLSTKLLSTESEGN